MFYNQDITLDLNTNSDIAYVVVNAKQGDNGRTITATILQDGQPYTIPSGTTASYRIRKANGGGSWNNAEINNNKVIITLTSSDLSSSGRSMADILFTVGTERISTVSFIIDVATAPNIIDPIMQSEAFDYLYDVIDQANYVIESAQAWSEGKRGTEEVVGDSCTLQKSGNFTATVNGDTFRANISPAPVGKIVSYVFLYNGSQWEYYNGSITEIVNLTTLGITISSGTPTSGDTITITASIADPAWHNNAKYYMEQSANASAIKASIEAIQSEINSIDSSISVLELKATAASASISTLWSDISAASSSISTLWANNIISTQSIIALESNVNAATQSVLNLNNSVIALQSNVNNIDTTLEETNMVVNNALSSLTSLVVEVNATTSSIISLDSRISAAEQSIITLASNIVDVPAVESRLETVEEGMVSLSSQMSGLELTMDQTTTTANAAASKANEAVASVQDMQFVNNIGQVVHASWICPSFVSAQTTLTKSISIPPGVYVITAHAPEVSGNNFLVQLTGLAQAELWQIGHRSSFTTIRDTSESSNAATIYLRTAQTIGSGVTFSAYEPESTYPHVGLDIVRIR